MPRGRFSSVTDDQLLAAYREHGTASRAARAVGMSPDGALRRLEKLGVSLQRNHFTMSKRAIVKANYEAYRDRGALRELAELVRQPYGTIKMFAHRERLTRPIRKVPSGDL